MYVSVKILDGNFAQRYADRQAVRDDLVLIIEGRLRERLSSQSSPTTSKFSPLSLSLHSFLDGRLLLLLLKGSFSLPCVSLKFIGFARVSCPRPIGCMICLTLNVI